MPRVASSWSNAVVSTRSSRASRTPVSGFAMMAAHRPMGRCTSNSVSPMRTRPLHASSSQGSVPLTMRAAAGGRVEVELRARATEVELSVSDTGIGISEADRAELFTRFFRAQEAHDRAIQGIGLGLSITKSIVESHGGRIEVDSEPGRGSRFRVVLPLHVARLAS